jgi:hypothetical protein
MLKKTWMNKAFLKGILSLLSLSFFSLPLLNLGAQVNSFNASQLVPRIEMGFSPRNGSFVEGSTFDIPVLINTRGASINGIELRLSFDRDRLEIVKPSSGQSIIGVWVEPPSYDNTRGLATYIGVIPNGITTSAGNVGTITFRAKRTGRAVVSVAATSKILLNDGQGTEAQVDFGRAEYVIITKAPDSVRIYSETHPYPSEWYNNDSPVIYWDTDEGVAGFSYVLDNQPATIPENENKGLSPTAAFEDLDDGLWYFHIKAYKNGVWGTTGHFLMRIDTAPPAEFKPEADYLLAAAALTERALVSFFTTDNLSGVDHYEVGIIDRNQPVTVSPAFVQAESPFQVPLVSDDLNVIVRAVDKAGNIRDVAINIGPPSIISKFLKDNLVYILLAIILFGLVGLIFHYLYGHHIVRNLRRAFELAENEEKPLNIEPKARPMPQPAKPDENPGYYPEV